MKTCKFHKDLRGTTDGSDAIHHPCGCSVLTTDMEKHNEDPYVGTVCGGVAHCYFCDLMTIVSDEDVDFGDEVPSDPDNDPPDHQAVWEAEADIFYPDWRNEPTEEELAEEKRRHDAECA